MNKLIIGGTAAFKFVIDDDYINELNNEYKNYFGYQEITADLIYRIINESQETEFEEELYNRLINTAYQYLKYEEWGCDKIEYTCTEPCPYNKDNKCTTDKCINLEEPR